MKKYLIFLFLLIGCFISKQPTVPPVTTPPKLDTVYVSVPVHDTVFQIRLITQIVGIPNDTTARELLIAPGATPLQSTLTIQAAINWQQTHSCVIKPSAGVYYITQPLVVANIQGNDYGQSFIDIEGPTRARNTPGNQCAQFIATFADGPVIALQQAKGSTIKNIIIGGPYTKSAHMDWLTLDTLVWSQWIDSSVHTNRTSPSTAICIDAFSRKAFFDSVKFQMYPTLKQYYLPNMSQAGSTDVLIDNCSFQQFPVDIIVTPSFQLNGELITISSCSFLNSMSAIAQTQAQSKMNKVVNCMVWGGVHTIIDCAHWGPQRGDAVCMPYVDGFNIAGYNYEFVAGTPINFEAAFSNINTDTTLLDTATHLYAEGLFRFCDFGGFRQAYPGNGPTFTRSGVMFRDSHIDFQTQQMGIPSPDFYVNCAGCVFDGVTLRQYNQTKETDRLVLADEMTLYRNCKLGYYPIAQRTDPSYIIPTVFSNVGLCYMPRYMPLNSNTDTTWWEKQIPTGQTTVYVNRATFNGYIIDANNKYQLWDYVLAQRNNSEAISNPTWNPNYIVGIVYGQRGDTILLQNMGVGLHTGEVLNTFIDRLVQ